MKGTRSHGRQGTMQVSNKAVSGTNALPKYQKGDYLRVELLSERAGSSMSMWMYVDDCDDKHAIVFGTIDTKPSERWGDSPRTGTKVAVEYHQVREHRQSW